ncbi:hypothetical protein N7490_006839 [Penicillium lividum]|nr:hypothetical protein N7490_006839 [Penicillium lividum]
MTARSDIGYLVGYVASNIWRIWIPRLGVRVVREAVFDEKPRYSAENEDREVEMPVFTAEPETVETGLEQDCELKGFLEDFEPVPDTENDRVPDQPSEGASTPGGATEVANPVENDDNSAFANNKHTEEMPHPTPPRSPDRNFSQDQGVDGSFNAFDDSLQVEGTIDLGQNMQLLHTPEPDMQPEEQDPEPMMTTDDESILQETPNVGNSNLHESHIIEGPRVRTAKRDPDFTYKTTIEDTAISLQAYATAFSAPNPTDRAHRDDLQPPPRHFKEVYSHSMCDAFVHAMKVELDGLKAKETYQTLHM